MMVLMLFKDIILTISVMDLIMIVMIYLFVKSHLLVGLRKEVSLLPKITFFMVRYLFC